MAWTWRRWAGGGRHRPRIVGVLPAAVLAASLLVPPRGAAAAPANPTVADPAVDEPISVGLDGSLGGAATGWCPQISGDGSILAFTSESAALVADVDNGRADAFVRNRATEPHGAGRAWSRR